MNRTVGTSHRRLLFRALTTLGLFCLLMGSAQSLSAFQQAGPIVEAAPTNKPPTAPDSGSRPSELIYLSAREFWLSFEVLCFGIVVVGVQFGLLRKKRMQADEVLRVFGVTLILIGTLFAITAGFSSDDIAPALGLFGTIAGYLVGRRPSPTAESEGDNANAAKSDRQST